MTQYLVTLVVESGESLTIEVLPNNPVETLQVLISEQFRVPVAQQGLYHNGNRLNPISTFESLGFSRDEVILIRNERRINISDIKTDVSPSDLAKLVEDNPHLLPQFEQADPEIAAALKTKNIIGIRTLLMKRAMAKHKIAWSQTQELSTISANPDTEENQRKIIDRINESNVQENFSTAMDENPESFGRVEMLYIPIEINGIPIKAFVDSGAQMTIMSLKCAQEAGILRLVDRRFSGEARGVGTAPIIGRVHIAQMKLGGSFFPVSITIIEKNDVDFLLGLDMLKRFRCVIDLREGCLRVETNGSMRTEERVRFLAENELPRTDQESKSSEMVQDNPIDAALKELVGMGFDENLARSVLQECEGDVMSATQMLLSMQS